MGRDQVFAGNGSDEVLAFAFLAFCEKGAAFADITYGFYPVFAQLFGIDGVILTALILSFPANEIFLPLILMGYLQSAALTEVGLTELHSLLLSQGWTVWTALAVMALCLFHWPCSTTLLTIRKETGSLRWYALSALLPTAISLEWPIGEGVNEIKSIVNEEHSLIMTRELTIDEGIAEMEERAAEYIK